MRIGSTRDLALYVRERRRDLGKSQSDVATAAGVSRRWLSDLESGKSTAEIGLVLKTLHALDIVLDAKPIGASEASGLNLDDLLRNLGDSHE